VQFNARVHCLLVVPNTTFS